MSDSINNPPYYFLGVLNKAVDVIEAIADRGAMSVAELVDYLGQDRNSVNRVVLTLKQLGYLTREDNKKYKLSLKLFRIGSRALDGADICGVIQRHMKALSDAFGQTVSLGQLNGFGIVTVDVIGGAQPIEFSTRIGEAAPVHCTSMGKAIMAAMNDEQLKRFIGGLPLTEFTSKSIVSKERLWREIKETRQRGYAVDDEEWVMGVLGLGIPAFTPKGQCSQSISISGSSKSFTEPQTRAITQKLLDVKKSIAEDMGLKDIAY